jgi:hypothetical protein
MDIDLARHVVRAAFRSSHELGELLPVLKEHCSEEEYRAYTKAIATAIASIQLELTNRAASEHPGLEQEIEVSMNKYGRYL